MKRMVIATWNVNSIRQRREQLGAWLEEHRPDALCLQETKVIDELFPAGLFDDCGYEVAYCGQKAYNGVAIASRRGLSEVRRCLVDECEEQKRYLEARVGPVLLANVYVPNGQRPGTPKYAYKLDFLAQLRARFKQLAKAGGPVVVGGDYNIAPRDEDVYDIDDWGRNSIAVSKAERAAHAELLACGYVDAQLELGAAPKAFTWWDYRQGSFRHDRGLRIDHFLVHGARVDGLAVDRRARGLPHASDHAPVVLELGMD